MDLLYGAIPWQKDQCEGMTDMKHIPRFWLMLLSLQLILFFGFASAESASISDFNYEITDGTCSVTGYCGSDNEICIPETIEGSQVIAVGGFARCFRLCSVALPQGLARIDESAFKMCVGLETVLFQQGLTEICSEAFSYCEQLKSIELPEGLIRIGDRAFFGCKTIGAVRIPASVIEIGEDAFSDCGSGLIVIVQPDSYALQYCEENQVPYAIDFRIAPEPSVESTPEPSVESTPGLSEVPTHPENPETWTCENGHEGNTGNFCPRCGAAKP